MWLRDRPKRDAVAILLLRTSMIVAFTRTAQILLMPLFVRNQFTNYLVTDNFHHYHVGLAAFVLMIIMYRYSQKYLAWVFALCLAWIIEEHLVIIYELGVEIPWTYLSTPDTIVIFLLALIGVVSSLVIRGRGKWAKRSKLKPTFDK